MTKWQLFNAFASGTPVTINGRACFVNSIEREDGSGHCFNLRVSELSEVKQGTLGIKPGTLTVRNTFVRTAD